MYGNCNRGIRKLYDTYCIYFKIKLLSMNLFKLITCFEFEYKYLLETVNKKKFEFID